MTFRLPWKRHYPLALRRENRDENPLLNIHEEMDRMFDDFFSGFGLARMTGDRKGFMSHFPRLDMSETDTTIEVTAELPGLDPKELDLSFNDGILTLKGEIKSSNEDKSKNHYFTERSYGSFQRSVQLPDEVDDDKIDARFENGVLHISFTKIPEAKTKIKKIAVKSS